MLFQSPSSATDALSTSAASEATQTDANTTTTTSGAPDTTLNDSISTPSETVSSTNIANAAANNATLRAGAASPADFPKFSASTEEILKRIRGNGTSAANPAAARESVLKSMVTSDRINLTPGLPAPRGKRGGARGGARGSPLATNGDGTGSGTTTPITGIRGGSGTPSSRGRGSGRGRGRGRGRGKGGKRKRENSDDDVDDESDASDEVITPVATQTRSGRQVAKPTVFVPPAPPTPTGTKRKRPAPKKKEEVCAKCKRPTSIDGNRIVFCDQCNTPWHQYCHDPPIGKEAATVESQAWSCSRCIKPRDTPQPPVPLFSSNDSASSKPSNSLVAAPDLTPDERRQYFSSLPHDKLVDLLTQTTISNPDLKVYQPDPRSKLTTIAPRHTNLSSLNPSNDNTSPLSSLPTSSPSAPSGLSNIASQGAAPTSAARLSNPTDLFDDEHTAHFPKPGHGIQLPPESDDMQFLVDDEQFPYFSHQDSYAEQDAAGESVNGY